MSYLEVGAAIVRRGRKPDPGVDVAIRDAVFELLQERGFEMTFDDVASRAGVGRASVFRRFSTKRDMILSAVSQMSLERIEAPDTGSLRGDLLALVSNIMAVFSEPRTRALARFFQGQACRDEAFTDVLRANLDRRFELIATVLGRGVDRGEPAPETDTKLIADLISGIIAIRLASDSPLPAEAEVARLVDTLLVGCTGRGS